MNRKLLDSANVSQVRKPLGAALGPILGDFGTHGFRVRRQHSSAKGVAEQTPSHAPYPTYDFLDVGRPIGELLQVDLFPRNYQKRFPKCRDRPARGCRVSNPATGLETRLPWGFLAVLRPRCGARNSFFGGYGAMVCSVIACGPPGFRPSGTSASASAPRPAGLSNPLV